MLPFIIFGFTAFNSAVSKLNNEVEAAYSYRLEKIAADMEGQLENLKVNALKIAYDNDLKTYMLKNNPYNEIVGIQNLKRYKESVLIADDCILFLKGNNEIYTSSGKYINDIYINHVVQYKKWGDIFEDLNECTNPFIRPRETIISNGNERKEVITFAYPISTVNTSNKDAVVVFLITTKALQERVRSVVGDIGGRLYMFDNKGEQITDLSFEKHEITNEELIEDKKIINTFLDQDNTSILSYMLNGKKYTAFKMLSPQGKMTYIHILLTEDYLFQVYQLSGMLKKVGFIALFAGILLVLLVSYSNYKPIGNLLKSVKKLQPQIVGQKFMNEIDTIGDVLKDSISANDNLRKRVDEQKSIIRQQLIISLLKGEFQKKTWDEFEHAGLYLNGPYYCVIVLSLGRGKVKRESLLKDIIITLIEDQYSIKRLGYAVELVYENYIAVVCNLSGSEKDAVQSLVSDIIDKCKQNSENVKVGIGNRYTEIRKINHSYIEAVSSVEYAKSINDKEVVAFEDIVSQYSHFAWYPSGQVIRFLQSIKQGDYELALINLEDMIKSIEDKQISRIMERYIGFDIVNSFIKALNEMNISLDPLKINALAVFNTTQELYNNMIKLTEEICNLVKERITSSQYQVFSNILQYVNSNFLSYDMSLNKITEEFDVSIYTLSKLFKEYTGLGFKEYLIEIRMEKAKELLATGQLTVGEIAQMVGYSNTSHFIKTFKNVKGVTPEQYRKTNSK